MVAKTLHELVSSATEDVISQFSYDDFNDKNYHNTRSKAINHMHRKISKPMVRGTIDKIKPQKGDDPKVSKFVNDFIVKLAHDCNNLLEKHVQSIQNPGDGNDDGDGDGDGDKDSDWDEDDDDDGKKDGNPSKGILQRIKEFIIFIYETMKSFLMSFMEFLSYAFKKLKELIVSLCTFVKDSVIAVVNKINSIIKSIWNWFSGSAEGSASQ